MSDCDHNCKGCDSDCGERKSPRSFQIACNGVSRVGRVFGVVSGKGGVGKSLVTSLLAASMRARGKKVAVLDADITGPSIPKMLGVSGRATGDESGIFPMESREGIKVMSLNLLAENETDPVVWRGPMIAETVKQFWTDVVWGDVDCMFVDMPPGTGDVPLTVFQSLPVDGIVMVTSPQELVGMIVAKAVKMAGMLSVPVLGVVENMSCFKCPSCGREHLIFGESRVDAIAAEFGIGVVAKLPFDAEFSRACDAGTVGSAKRPELDGIVSALENAPKREIP